MSAQTIAEYPYGHPFWVHKPELGELTSDPWALISLFGNGHAFVNGIRGTPAHPDSYMTVLDYERAHAVFDIINEEYRLEADVWVNFANYFINDPNRQPITVLLARYIKRLLNRD